MFIMKNINNENVYSKKMFVWKNELVLLIYLEKQ